jgi:acyl-CoA dehydrogenase family protein 9
MDEQQKRLADEFLFGTKKQPSFAKQLFFGTFAAEKIFPYPCVSPDEEERTVQFLDKLNKFAEANIDPNWIDRHATIPDSVIDGLRQLDVFGMTVPREFGGLSMSQYAYCRATEVLARRCSSTALFVNVHQSIGLRALLLFGTPEQRGSWLPPLAKGEFFAAFSLTEPNAGSDASGVETRAVFDPTRNIYRINGRKQWTTNGSIAQVLTVMAQTEVETPKGRQDKITAFLVTPDMPGFSVTAAALEKVGMRGTKTANLSFNNMEVPASSVLGPVGGGLKVCLTVLDYGRTTFGASCTGIAKDMIAKAIDHARNRYQFKRPLASFGLVKQKIANMSALTYAMDATTYMTAGLIDSGVEDFMLEAAMLKVFASDALWSIIYDTMQIYGGRSFFTDAPFERVMRDSRLNMIGEGSNEVMRAFIAAVGMRDVGMELKTVKDAFSAPIASYETLLGFGKSSLRRLYGAKVPVRSRILFGEAAKLENAVRRFGIAVVRTLAKYKEEVIEKQLDLDRISTAAMALYTMTAVISKLDSDLTRVNGKVEALGNDVAIAKLYCQQALETIEKSLSGLFTGRDKEVEDLSDQICGIKKA